MFDFSDTFDYINRQIQARERRLLRAIWVLANGHQSIDAAAIDPDNEMSEKWFNDMHEAIRLAKMYVTDDVIDHVSVEQICDDLRLGLHAGYKEF